MSVNDHTQVVIIGAGPAGISAALTLAARNVSCTIVDAIKSGIDKPGECIPPNALPLFRQLGLEGLLEQEDHLLYHGNQSVWGNDKVEEKLFLFEKHTKGILLNRSVFEEQLRGLCLKSRSRFLSGYSLQALENSGNKINVTLRSKKGTLHLSCDHIIDATGRKASVCRKLAIEKEEADQLMALDFQCMIKKEIPAYVHVESFDNGWIYVAPSGKNKLSVMLFSDPDQLPEKENHEKFIMDVIGKTLLIKPLLQELTEKTILNLKVRTANSAALKKPYGSNWLAIGDAAYSYDPVSSYGITSALAGGYYGGHALADKIAGKPEAMEAYHYIMENAFQDYRIKLHNYYNLEKRWSASNFWKKRHAEFKLR